MSNQTRLNIFYNNQIVSSTGAYLYNVLIKPIEEFLVDINKVIIIPDLGLSSFPFETLIRPNSLITSPPHYLIFDFDIISKRMRELSFLTIIFLLPCGIKTSLVKLMIRDFQQLVF